MKQRRREAGPDQARKFPVSQGTGDIWPSLTITPFFLTIPAQRDGRFLSKNVRPHLTALKTPLVFQPDPSQPQN
jgi:hypothetical protein